MRLLLFYYVTESCLFFAFFHNWLQRSYSCWQGLLAASTKTIFRVHLSHRNGAVIEGKVFTTHPLKRAYTYNESRHPLVHARFFFLYVHAFTLTFLVISLILGGTINEEITVNQDFNMATWCRRRIGYCHSNLLNVLRRNFIFISTLNVNKRLQICE